ncbi:MAG: hypothetical protein WC797_02285 [Candidatus Paceibacterota bacterium]|jgi:hypothetical protein
MDGIDRHLREEIKKTSADKKSSEVYALREEAASLRNLVDADIEAIIDESLTKLRHDFLAKSISIVEYHETEVEFLKKGAEISQKRKSLANILISKIGETLDSLSVSRQAALFLLLGISIAESISNVGGGSFVKEVAEAVKTGAYKATIEYFPGATDRQKERWERIRLAFGDGVLRQLYNKHDLLVADKAGAGVKKENPAENETKIGSNLPDSMSPRATKELIKSLPPQISSATKEVYYTDKVKYLDASYGLPPGTVALAFAHQNEGKVELCASAATLPRTAAVDTLVHEIGHLNDWTSERIDFDLSTELLERVLLRLEDPNRYNSWYVESIKSSDLQMRRRKKATEYFAEIFSLYYCEQGRLPTADRELIEWYLKKYGVDTETHSFTERQGVLNVAYPNYGYGPNF